MSDPEFDPYPDLPEEDGETNGEAAQARQQLTVRSMNQNLGAIRTDVQRDMRAVRLRIREEAQWAGKDWEYRLPFKKRLRDERGRPIMENGKPKTATEWIVGPTVDCAMAIASAYGNCTVYAGIVQENVDAYIIEATFVDIQTGFQTTRPFRQAKERRIGAMGGDAGRVQEALTGIGVSKAKRNVVCEALGALVEFGLEHSRRSFAASVEKRRGEAEATIRDRCMKHGIPLERIEGFYGDKLADMNARVLAQVLHQLNAVRDGLVTADQICPEGAKAPVAGEPAPERTESELPEETEQEEAVEEDEKPEPATEQQPAPPKPEAAKTDQRPARYLIFGLDGKISHQLGPDDEAYAKAFAEAFEDVPVEARAKFCHTNIRRLADVATRLPILKKFVPKA
jgi:hypothetical protein